MDHLQREIELAKRQVEQAAEVLKTAIQRRNLAKKAGVPRQSLEESVTAAQAVFNAAEVRMRTLYEGKGDWVPFSQVVSSAASPAPIAVGSSQVSNQ